MAWRPHNLSSLLIALCLLISTPRSVAVVDNSTSDSAYLTFEYNGITYHVFVDEVTWREAYSLCKVELSVLAKIPDQETQDVITTHLNSDRLLKKGAFWIDVNDEYEEGVWVDSEFNELTYTAWAPNEPNNGGYSQHDENCVHLWWRQYFKWNDNWCESQIYFICQTGIASRCYTTEDGHDYLGTVSTTEMGLDCQYWSEQTPHVHTSHKPYPSLKGHNYCRNPDGSGDKPWCYTTDPDTRWEYCSVGYSQLVCDKDDIECFELYDGRDYMGHISVTETGKTCQSWNVQTPHRHSYRGDDYLGEHNYCRNPNYSSRPWCYTTDPDILWQYCDVCGDGETFTGDNIALSKRASQSSVYSAIGPASNAVDGFTSPFWGDESCSHTNIEQDPWWKVDLEYTYFVKEVVITNRRDCCSERLKGAVVRVGMSTDIGSNSQCGETVSPYTAKQFTTSSFQCAIDTVGRYVSVQLEGKNQYLSLCEVEVHGSRAMLWRPDQRCGPEYPTLSNIDGECNPADGFPCCSQFGWCGSSTYHCGCFDCIDYREVYGKDDSEEEEEEAVETNLALLKEATQSSVFEIGVASNAVDGRKNRAWDGKSCTHTLREDDAWWKVDLGDVNPIDRVVITNRADYYQYRLQGAVVRVGTEQNITRNSKCGDTLSVGDAYHTPIIFKCYGVTGNVVSVQLEGRRDHLTLCEVEVYKREGDSWWEDMQCGPRFTAPNGVSPAQCNPHGIYPCCSTANWCGISDDHCKCDGCIDYREVYKVADSPVDACSEPKRLTIPDDGEVNVTSPAYPNLYPSYANCQWFITANSDLDIEVTVNEVDLETCCANVYIGTGDTLRQNELFTITNMTTTSTVAESNKVWIQFVSSAGQVHRGEGFSITLKPKSTGNAWREDVQCGPGFTAPNGVSPAECNPHGIYPCCSTANWCGISDDHCKCYGCIDYREVYGVTESPVDACSGLKRITIPDDGELNVTSPAYPNLYPSYANCRWFITADSELDIEVTVNEVDLETCCANVYIGTGDTLRLNELFTITNMMTTSTVAESNKVWIQFISSASQVQRGAGFSITLKAKPRGNAWREDVQCGPGFTAPNGVSPAECDPHGIYPCCSTANWCGISDDHCKCDGCIDYREVYGVTESPVDACSAPKRITIPDDGEVTVTSPAYPNLYPSYANCRWFIAANPDLDIEVTVNKVDLETCSANVYIGTGDTLRRNELFTITNTMTTSTVAESNKVWIQFVSSSSQVQRGEGFSITLKPKSRPPSCVSRWSEISGPGDDVQVEIECEEGEVMTSCNSVTDGSESHGTRDGERIIQVTSKPKCVAQNGEGGLGVYAVARCCKWSGLQCRYTESVWKSGTGDDDVAEAMCDMSVNDLPASTLGCMAYTYGQWLDGARPWTDSEDLLTNFQLDFVRSGCLAQNGNYGNGVWSEASCCSAPGLQCQHIYSDKSDGASGAVAHVQCEEGWVMTGCSVFTYWGVTDGAYVTNDGMCKAINGGEASMDNNTRGVWAVAVCCKSSDQ
ncbi:uncharacterized protein [Ptychodera flava]|uniref:uncharacterized protein n=1 Tax=Ptychodera flava TaxID=63121 RepID=UPI003969CD9F